MVSNLKLYGTEDVPKVPAYVCNERLELLKERLDELMGGHWSTHDVATINEVLKAQEHWKRLRDDGKDITWVRVLKRVLRRLKLKWMRLKRIS